MGKSITPQNCMVVIVPIPFQERFGMVDSGVNCQLLTLGTSPAWSVVGRVASRATVPGDPGLNGTSVYRNRDISIITSTALINCSLSSSWPRGVSTSLG
ncbi:hypothetical protein J6590_000209 [Homalodisca vitripennis]|nr:hypothetical protein J6590_000209 [Homalodisca vitripennis]